MEILSITLKNFKSHSDRHFKFQIGTNAICGENGAGKTSILEAIAWTLFNYRGSYRNEDLIRNGAGSAQATVAFVSNQDGRTYEVQRCTTKGYTLYDPQLGQRLDYKHIEEEVMPWLRQHLGVAPGTDLGRLFANTIGVPQGTFTADFLQPPEKRKPIFDAVLKVEEYRQANQEMLSLERYGKAEVENLEQAIAHYNDTLQGWALLQQRHQELSQAIAQDQAAFQQLQAELTTLQTEKDQLTTKALQVQQLESRLQNLTAQANGKCQTNALLKQSLERSNQAVQVCELNNSSYKVFLQAEAVLKELDQQGKRRQALLKRREGKQTLLTERQIELAKLTLQLETLTQAQSEIERLQPFIQQQVELEQRQTLITEQLQQLQTRRLEQQNLTKQITKIQADLTRLEKDVQRIRALESEVNQIPELEQRRDRLQEQLSRIEAAKQFEADLRHLVEAGENKRDRHQDQTQQALEILQQVQQTVPLLATASVDLALTAIQAGVTLNNELLATLHQILADLSEQISAPKLRQQLQTAKLQLDTVYQQRAEFGTLEAKQEQQGHLKEEATQLQIQVEQLRAELVTESGWQQERSQTATALSQLGDPRGRSQLLGRDLQQRSRLQTVYTQTQQIQTVVQQECIALDEQLVQFAQLEVQIDEQKQLRQAHQSGYLTYLQHQKEADQLPKLKIEIEQAIVQLQQLEAERAATQVEHQQLTEHYDPQQWRQVETTYNDTRSRADRIEGSLPQQYRLLKELDSQLTALQAVAEKRDRAETDLKPKEQVRKFITFARKVYKEAGPRITERYVQTISCEADRLFRELMNRPNVALEWTRDYEVMVQEGAHTRRFINLSGGEQMCAALAVRLALLRVLVEIDIAFFDEPTTNMDRSRRESLAEAIANIKTFRQLFVISHDDTFEKVTENIILVERE